MSTDPLKDCLASLVDDLPEPEHEGSSASPPPSAAMQLFRTLTSYPAEAREEPLRRSSQLDCLQWTIARRWLRRRDWITVCPSRIGRSLLAPTTTGRAQCAPDTAPTKFELLLAQYGDFAELVGDLHTQLGHQAERWLPAGQVLDVVAVQAGRGVAALALHPERRRADWRLVLDEVVLRGVATLFLLAWPEHRLLLADALDAVSEALAVHPGRLGLELTSGLLAPEADLG